MFETKLEQFRKRKYELIEKRAKFKDKIRVINVEIDKIVTKIHDEEQSIINKMKGESRPHINND